MIRGFNLWMIRLALVKQSLDSIGLFIVTRILLFIPTPTIDLTKLRPRFFWQLLAAFMLVIILAGGGVFLASSPDSITRGIFSHDVSSEMTRIWSNHLADYYARRGSWSDIAILSISYRRAPWDDEYNPVDYILATAKGEIVAASDSARMGQSISSTERNLAIQFFSCPSTHDAKQERQEQCSQFVSG